MEGDAEMKLRSLTTLAVVACFATPWVRAEEPSKVSQAASAAASGASRAGTAVKRGVESAASAAERGLNAGGRAAKKGAEVATDAVKTTAERTADGVKRGVQRAEGIVGASSAPKRQVPVEDRSPSK
jgi:hypothetical protein